MTSKLIKDLQHLRLVLSLVKHPSAKKDIDVITEAISTIEDLSAKVSDANMERSSMYYNCGWVPATERLPKEYGDYLVTWQDKLTNRIYLEIVECDPDDEDIWIGDIPQSNGYKVLAWMPLPKLYQSKREVAE